MISRATSRDRRPPWLDPDLSYHSPLAGVPDWQIALGAVYCAVAIPVMAVGRWVLRCWR